MMNVSLPPQLERIVRHQLATGRFHTESEVVAAAIQLLGDQDMSLPARPKRSPRGLLADLHNDVSFEDCKQARRQAWFSLADDDGS